MTENHDYEDAEDSAVDEDEAKAAEDGASEDESSISDIDLQEAESLTVTAKQKKRQALEDEIAAFLARGGKITEVPPDENAEQKDL